MREVFPIWETIVRMSPDNPERIDHIVLRLLDEVLKDYLWHCRISTININEIDEIIFLPRPPELVSLASLTKSDSNRENTTLIVYPDPPLGAEEERLFEAIAPSIRLRSINEWSAGVMVK